MPDDIRARLLFEHTPFAPTDDILIYRPPDVHLVRQVAQRVRTVTVYETSYRASLDLQRLRAGQGHIRDADAERTGIYPQAPLLVDKAIIISPKGRDYTRALLISAGRVLRQGGQVILIGGNSEGIKTVIKDANALFGNSTLAAYKARHRIAFCTLLAPLTDLPDDWGDDPTQIHGLSVETPLGALTVAALPGVFSWRKLDAGTRLLLEQPALREAATGATVLDVGCGTGVLGCALASVAQRVMLVDDNKLAVDCALYTAQANGLHNTRVAPSDVYSALDDERFDLIVSNPPFHQGFDVERSVARRIISEAARHLTATGRLILVANAFLPYEKLMREHFAQVTQLANDGKYVVLQASEL